MALRSERALTAQQGGARLEPPANTEPLTQDGQHTQPWALFFQQVADRLAGLNMGGTRSASVTSDANGRITAQFEPPFPTAATYVAIHDFAGIAVGLDNVEATREGFTGILMSDTSVLYDYTTNFWAVGY